MDMKKFMRELPKSRKPLPIMTYPTAKALGVSVHDLTHDPVAQADVIIKTAEKYRCAAAVTVMDLSVEAEAFGCEIIENPGEVPTVVGSLICDVDDLDGLKIPNVGDGRTGVYIEAAKLAKAGISKRPVLAGMIGPFSLCGRLMDVSEALVNCIADPEFTHAALRTVTDFLKEYALAYKRAGLDGIVLAEPLSGLLSPALEKEFSAAYVKEIIGAAQDDSFAVIYHNCGPNVPLMAESLLGIGAMGYHFGDAIELSEMLEKFPPDIPVMGNISPSGQLVNGTPESVSSAVFELIGKCAKYGNFVLSTGCDVPPGAKSQNIDAFFDAAEKYYC